MDFMTLSPKRPSMIRLESETPLLPYTNKITRRRSLARTHTKWLLVMISSFLCLAFIALLLLRSDMDKDTWFQHPYIRKDEVYNSSIPPDRMIMANSHNDEMQGNDALELALGLGYGFIEIDTYLARNPDSAQSDENKGTELNRNFTLLAGHDVKDLKSSRTLKKYYFDPLLNILDKNNKNRTLVSNGTGNVWKGIYKNDSDKEVTIFIDMKRDGELIWPYLLDLLQPFISKDYLTYYNVSSSEWSYGPLKIIGTGLTPLNRVYYSSIRYVFYDAPLTKLNKPFKIEKSLDGPEVNNIEWDKTISPIASSKLPLKYIISTFFSFKSNTNKGNCKLKSIHLIAREKGIQSRWWGYSNNPNWLKVKLWNVLRNSGQDILNTDYLIQSKNWLNDREKQTRNLYKC